MFYEQFIRLCKERGMSPAAVTREIGVNNSSSTAWKRGSIPKGETLQKLADYFGVSVDYLLGKDDGGAPFAAVMDDYSIHLLKATANLSEADRRLVLDMARRLRDAGRDAAAVQTSAGPYYLYSYPDGAETPPAPPSVGKDTPAAEAPPESPEDGG